MKLAIDFGTTNTVIARWDSGVQIVTLPDLSAAPDADGTQALVPSLVYVRDGQARDVIIGQAVRTQQLDGRRDNRLFRNFKRGIVALPSPEPRLIDGRLWGDREAGDLFLRTLLESLPQGQVDQLVLTAPVSAFESYLSWLGGVLGDLSSDRTYMVDESTAAALGYAVTEPGAPVFVFDFGGGTLDLSLVQLPESRQMTGGVLSRLRRTHTAHNTARVIAKAGRILGGSDIDQWILAWVLQQMNLAPADLGEDYAALLTRCEQAKIRLSTDLSADITFDKFDKEGSARTVTITRADLEALLTANGFYDALRHVIDKVMNVAHRSGIFKEDVKYVLLVGGVSLMPSVQAALKSYFGDAAVRADKPFTAVAAGALQVAMGFGLDDYLSQGYGLRYFDAQTGTHRYDEIIPAGSRYPSDQPVEVDLSAAHERQPSVEFVVGEIGTQSGALIEVSYEGGETVFIARSDADSAPEQIAPLNARDPVRVRLDPPGNPGERRLRARFMVDDQRRLRLKVTDLKTRQELLRDDIVAVLDTRSGSPETDADSTGCTTGYEPTLSDHPRSARLSLRRVASMLNLLPADRVPPDAAEAALRSDSFGARYNAAIALSKRADREARNVIQRVLTDGEAPARASVARHLNGFTWYTAEPLFRQALADPDERVRAAAVYALCDLNELHAYHLMIDKLVNEVDSVYDAAAVGLRDRQETAAVPVLRAALQADDPDVRVRVLEALSANNTPDALPVVRAAFTDDEPDVVYAAVLSLLELGRENALEEVAALIVKSRVGVRVAVLRACFHATNYLNINPSEVAAGDAIFAALENALHDDFPPARTAAVWSLAWMHHERADRLLNTAYRCETNSAVKAELVRVVVGLMSPIAEEVLGDALASDDPQVKQVALEIKETRARAGVVPRYDEIDGRGTGFAKPSLGQ